MPDLQVKTRQINSLETTGETAAIHQEIDTKFRPQLSLFPSHFGVDDSR